jgi:hypothetical protein
MKFTHKESYRTYYFPEGEIITLIDVVELKVSPESGNHRLKCEDGTLHIIPTGWLHIKIVADDWSW